MKQPEKIYIILIMLFFFTGLFATRTFATTGFIEDDIDNKTAIVVKTIEFLKERKPGISLDRVKAIANSVYDESEKYAMDYRLILAVMKVESNFKNEAISRRGARGLMQIQPASARFIGRKSGIEVKGARCLHEPEKNIKIGVTYLSRLRDMFDNIVSALHAYNAGPAKVKKADPGEKVTTTSFTRKVMSEYRQIVEILPDPEEE